MTDHDTKTADTATGPQAAPKITTLEAELLTILLEVGVAQTTHLRHAINQHEGENQTETFKALTRLKALGLVDHALVIDCEIFWRPRLDVARSALAVHNAVTRDIVEDATVYDLDEHELFVLSLLKNTPMNVNQITRAVYGSTLQDITYTECQHSLDAMSEGYPCLCWYSTSGHWHLGNGGDKALNDHEVKGQAAKLNSEIETMPPNLTRAEAIEYLHNEANNAGDPEIREMLQWSAFLWRDLTDANGNYTVLVERGSND